MGKVISCEECRKAYRSLEALEDLRDNDSVCLVCNHPIEVDDWDRVLASYEDDDYDDVDEEDEEDEDDFGDDDFGDEDLEADEEEDPDEEEFDDEDAEDDDFIEIDD
jgi:acetyl-CoA carboxylase beta subunit